MLTMYKTHLNIVQKVFFVIVTDHGVKNFHCSVTHQRDACQPLQLSSRDVYGLRSTSGATYANKAPSNGHRSSSSIAL